MPRPTIRNFIAQNAQKSRVGEISLRGIIGESNQDGYDYWCGGYIEAWGAGTVKELESEIAALNVDEIHLLVSSEGGSFFDALTIADILNRHPARVVAIVEGYAFSAATVLICKCADEIQMASNAFLMIHPCETWAAGNAAALMSAANLCIKTTATAAAVYASRGGADAAKFSELMDAETYLDGNECAALKLADVVTDAVVLTNYRPAAHAMRNEQSRSRMPQALRALFDTPKAPESTTDPDMTPEEIQALITNGINTAILPLNTKITALETTNAEQGKLTALEPLQAKVKTLEDTNVAQAAELTALRGLQKTGVLEAAGSPGAPVTNPGKPTAAGTDEPKIDFENMNAAQLINAGRKRMGKDKAPAAAAAA